MSLSISALNIFMIVVLYSTSYNPIISDVCESGSDACSVFSMSCHFSFFLNDFFFVLFLLFLNVFIFIYLWLCWVFVSVWGLSLAVASGGHSSSRCAGLSLLQPLLLRSTGSRRTGSVIMAHGPSCSTACGIFPDQGSNPCPLHWQADSQPLRHQGSPVIFLDSWMWCAG